MFDAKFSVRVLNWFDRFGRKDLPWQHPASAYRVWVSEIMLQQTQVATVIPYFNRFMRRFPDIPTLAEAPLDEVLHYWSGLGYYARARNLHKAAIFICDQHAGQFPLHYEPVRILPGVGRSTAGAILALAQSQRHPILDGNVKRVLARHRLIEGWPGNRAVAARLWQAAEEITPGQRIAEFTQAMMDLGALICVRHTPCCHDCPVMSDCGARLQARQRELPASKPRAPLPVRNTAMIMVYNTRGEVLLERRPPTGLWGGLLSFPEVAGVPDAQPWCTLKLGISPEEIIPWPVHHHTFSHFKLKITPLEIRLDTPPDRVMEERGMVWYNMASVRGGLAAPVQKLIQQMQTRQEQTTHDSNGKLRQTAQRG
jgi:A/G-specific adenine glycosylase